MAKPPKEIELGKSDETVFLKAISDESIPNIYANGFINALGNGDGTIVFQRNSHPVLVLNMSYTLCKTLAIKLGQMISDIEEGSGNTIMATDEIAKALSPKK